jgi:acetylornithine aminotransferase/acetylornithine/N-succinyldiaminopimelate aminotransferase
LRKRVPTSRGRIQAHGEIVASRKKNAAGETGGVWVDERSGLLFLFLGIARAVFFLGDLEGLTAAIDNETAGVIVEPIQGEGGVHPCTPEFLVGLRRLCDQHNLLLILDEVKCGIGRTGKFFAFDHAGVRADAVGMAKGLGGGFPIGAIWVGEGAADLFQPGSHGTTFGGTPLACAAGLAVFDVLEREGLMAHVLKASAPWIAELAGLARDFPAQVTGVRGMGFMVGVQLTGEAPP